jgi:hypothetical protein
MDVVFLRLVLTDSQKNPNSTLGSWMDEGEEKKHQLTDDNQSNTYVVWSRDALKFKLNPEFNFLIVRTGKGS